MVGSSAQQILTLTLEVLMRQYGSGQTLVAIEESGYPTAMDMCERAGASGRARSWRAWPWTGTPQSLTRSKPR